MMDLMHNHNYRELYELQKKHEWNQAAGMRAVDAVGRRVGVLGYGSIGRQGTFLIFSSIWTFPIETSVFSRDISTGRSYWILNAPSL
jgi:hypothetical protein